MDAERQRLLERQRLRTTDTRIRQRPPTAATLRERMRAGRLAPWRVALAAWLGDPLAQATGVEAWEGRPVPSHEWPARVALEHADARQGA